MNNMFRLLSTYDYFVNIKNAPRLVRIEILCSTNDSNILRGRVWIQNIYNLYPTLINSDKNGNDLHAIHSADELNVEISSIVIDDNRYSQGVRCEGEQEIVRYLTEKVKQYVDSLERG